MKSSKVHNSYDDPNAPKVNPTNTLPNNELNQETVDPENLWNEEDFEFDYAFVFKLEENKSKSKNSPADESKYSNPIAKNFFPEKQSKTCKYCIKNLLEAGFEVKLKLSLQKDELFVIFRCPEHILKQFAERIQYKCICDPDVLRQTLIDGDIENHIKPIFINESKSLSKFSPYDYIYLEYHKDFDNIYQKYYHSTTNSISTFSNSDRLKLTYLLLRASREYKGCELEISKLLYNNKILALYPLHNNKEKRLILNKVLYKGTFPWTAPFDLIRNYFGEKIALYNVFLGHYSHWLLSLGIIGLAVQLVVLSTWNFTHPILPFFSIIVTIWSVFMLEYWKRKEQFQALKWGMTDFEKNEQERPEYIGNFLRSPITGKMTLYYPDEKSKILKRFSQFIVTSFASAVIGVVACIYVLRFYLQNRDDTSNYSSIIASVLNTIQIQIFNTIYSYAAIKLTNKENQRTDTAYEDSLIIKMFVFQFINSYSSFFFIAFIAANLDPPKNNPNGFLGQCGASNCMEPLTINLLIIFGTRIFVTNFVEIIMSYITHRNKLISESKGTEFAVGWFGPTPWSRRGQMKNSQVATSTSSPDIGLMVETAQEINKINDTASNHDGIPANYYKRILTNSEKDFFLMEYDTTIESIYRYSDTAIQFGFTVLFVTALPAAAFLSLLSNYAKLRFDMWKLLKYYQRPIPVGAQDIGTWLDVFYLIAIAGVITNSALICFTMSLLWDYSFQFRLWIFIGFQWCVLGLQYITQLIIPDIPEEVEMQIQRAEFMKEKILDKEHDDEFNYKYEKKKKMYFESKQSTSNQEPPQPLRSHQITRNSSKMNIDENVFSWSEFFFGVQEPEREVKPDTEYEASKSYDLERKEEFLEAYPSAIGFEVEENLGDESKSCIGLVCSTICSNAVGHSITTRNINEAIDDVYTQLLIQKQRLLGVLDMNKKGNEEEVQNEIKIKTHYM